MVTHLTLGLSKKAQVLWFFSEKDMQCVGGKSLYVVTNLLNGEGKFKPSGRTLLLRLKQVNFDCKMLTIRPCVSSLEPLCSHHRSPWS